MWSAETPQGEKRMIHIVAVLSVLMGFIITAAGCWQFVSMRAVLRDGIPATARVTELVQHTDVDESGAATSYLMPILTYVGEDGRQTTITKGSYPPGLKVGDTVAIRYSRRDPERAEFDNPGPAWQTLTGSLSFGLGSWIFGASVLLTYHVFLKHRHKAG